MPQSPPDRQIFCLFSPLLASSPVSAIWTPLISLAAEERAEKTKEAASNPADRADDRAESPRDGSAIAIICWLHGDCHTQLSIQSPIGESAHAAVLRSSPDGLRVSDDGASDTCSQGQYTKQKRQEPVDALPVE